MKTGFISTSLTHAGMHRLRRLWRLLVAAALLAGSAATASAQITFAGTTSFQFNGAGGYSSTKTVGGLTLANTGFQTVTDAVTGIGNVGGTLSNFGTASLTNQNFTYSGNTVQLMIAFTTPTVASQIFFANMLGRVVTVGNQGGLSIIFNPSTINNIPFSNGPGSGTLNLAINDIDITPGQVNQAISGRIVATTTTPEPASLALLGTGLLGIIAVARRRK